MQALADARGVDEVEAIYDHMAAGGILWKPQPGLYRGNRCGVHDVQQADYHTQPPCPAQPAPYRVR